MNDMPKEAPKASNRNSSKEVDGLITAADAIRDASAKLETATAFLRTIKKVGEAGIELDKVRLKLLNVAASVKSYLIGVSDKDESVAEKIRVWLIGTPGAAAPAPVVAPTPEVPPTPSPAPAPVVSGAQEPEVIPLPVEDLLMKVEDFLRNVDQALFEQGLTKERPQPKKQMKRVWQTEETGTKRRWYTKGTKGHGYGSGGKFNNH